MMLKRNRQHLDIVLKEVQVFVCEMIMMNPPCQQSLLHMHNGLAIVHDRMLRPMRLPLSL